jgi:uncharacterized Zn-binding protein involved in type VI secretion
MSRFVHRDTDLRVCGAHTVAQCSDVRVNNLFISIQDDPNDHQNGQLIASDTVGKVLVNGKPVILLGDHAKPDDLCPSGEPHCDPYTVQASGDVKAGGGS